MKWYKNLYVGEKAYEVCEDIMDAVENEGYYKNAVIIALETGDDDQLVMISAAQLHFPGVRKRLGTIVGLALGLEEAYDIICRMASEVYKHDKTADIRRYLTEKL